MVSKLWKESGVQSEGGEAAEGGQLKAYLPVPRRAPAPTPSHAQPPPTARYHAHVFIMIFFRWATCFFFFFFFLPLITSGQIFNANKARLSCLHEEPYTMQNLNQKERLNWVQPGRCLAASIVDILIINNDEELNNIELYSFTTIINPSAGYNRLFFENLYFLTDCSYENHRIKLFNFKAMQKLYLNFNLN